MKQCVRGYEGTWYVAGGGGGNITLTSSSHLLRLILTSTRGLPLPSSSRTLL